MLKGSTGKYATSKWVGSYDYIELEKVAKAYAELMKCGEPILWESYDFKHNKKIWYFITDRMFKEKWDVVVQNIGLTRRHVDDRLKMMWFLKKKNGLV